MHPSSKKTYVGLAASWGFGTLSYIVASKVMKRRAKRAQLSQILRAVIENQADEAQQGQHDLLRDKLDEIENRDPS